ncbi:MAG: IMP dehydrogenase [Nitrososphaerota archaeon]
MPSFYERLRDAVGAYTFRDVILLPGLSEVEPQDVDLGTRFSTNIILRLPFVSSPMDTVTEADMAIALAREGGIGVLHRNMSVEEQVDMARRVKRAESFIIRDVVTISPKATVREALELMARHNISGLPVVLDGRLVGIVTKRDVSFAAPSLLVEAVMTRDVITAGPSITIEEAKAIMHQHRVEKLPVVDSEKRVIGLITIKDIYSREKYTRATRDEEGRLRVAAAISPFDLERARALDRYVDALVTDVAHFHNRAVLEAAKRLAKEVSADLIIGNLGTSQGVEDAITYLERVDGLRMGIGSGSTCLTSDLTKAGAPTLFAVAQAADVLRKYGQAIPIIADGGIRNPGDAAVALAAGASSVMMGFVFAGCTESPGHLIKVGNRYYKPHRGMGSAAARQRRYAVDRYQPSKGIAEGVEGLVPYRGDVAKVVEEFEAGLKAALGYAGAKSIQELWERATFALVTPSGVQELRPHSIILPGEGAYEGS